MMQNYINQLIQDFKLAEDDPVEEFDLGNSYEKFEAALLEIEESKPIPAGSILGVSYEELPPADKLTVDQTQSLLEAMLNALSAKGTGVSFPGNGVPVALAYSELREQFKRGFHAMPGWIIDFCSGWCPDCAFADYCTSKDDDWAAE